MADKIDILRLSRLLPLLNKGTTKNSFQMAGKTPTDSDKLQTNVKRTLTTEANRFKISGVMNVLRESVMITRHSPVRLVTYITLMIASCSAL
jgi:hypothetical protein